MLSLDEFHQKKQQGFTHVPLVKKRLVDSETPVTVFAKLRGLHDASYLFESVEKAERWGRYSIIGLGSDCQIEYQHQIITITDAGETTSQACSDPLAKLEELRSKYRVCSEAAFDELPRLSGGFVGYFGYDLIRTFEPVLGAGTAPDPMNMPDMWLVRSDRLVIFDNLKNVLWIVTHAKTSDPDGYRLACEQLELIESALDQPVSMRAEPFEAPIFHSMTSEQQYSDSVNSIKEYIRAGDVMQVVPAQRMKADFTADALSVYRALRHLNPSPYMFLIHAKLHDGDDFDLIGSSPEILSRIQNGVVTVRPLAGTRPRGATPEEDLKLEKELLADQKEVAEHLMLIDLGRNDVGRIAQVGKVRVTDRMSVERYSHVMHIASNVEADIDPSVSALEVFKATFPAGTLSGAPKIRAMQIIDELEPYRRTVFGGAVGYINWQGNMDTAIAIRTAVVRDRQLYVQAGAGVVEDSDAKAEWTETLNKSKAITQAVSLAAIGLDLDAFTSK